ncbi:hypothetical protein LJY25_06950 [Hymenobacter sp. BT175]|uniref:hypothetical protein n=1 Tax=Hymenobacter translucens TaxID=2886507 RepID=UPI001D0F094F|nr:hypothetical protein [Hymenobacter translucens]MCC2546177.1 hypothetical protein [Hymenobacter translucens]
MPAWSQTKPQQQPPAGTPAPPPKYQGKLSKEPAQFMVDVQSMMASINSAASRQLGTKFQQLWASNKLTATQQGRIVELSQQMLARKFKPRPHFESLFRSVVAGATVQAFTDQQMDEFLTVAGKSIARDQYKEVEEFLASSAQFLDTKVLYKSGYSRLRVLRGTFSFAYNETDQPFPAPVATPKPADPAPAATGATPAKPAAKPAPKKKSSDGWDTGDIWSGADDGWGNTGKKTPGKTTPAGTAPAAPQSGGFSSAPSYGYYQSPPTRGPVLLLKDADLFISTAADSALIQKTNGIVVASTKRFVGQGGQFAWNVSGNPVTADLTSYDFDMTRPEFTAQPVTLTYPAVLEAPIQGAVSYKSVRKKAGSTDSGYPRFISLTNDARVKNIGENIRYQGGFSLAGARMLSASLDGSLSRITVNVDGKTKFRATSGAYVLGDSVITAARAAVTIFEDKSDSLTHPGVKLKYSKPRQLLQLAREEGLYKTTPYYDSYHQMEITTELLTWPLRTPYINFSIITAKNQVAANFESREFYTNTRYQQLKGINRLHPLQMVVGYSNLHEGRKTFTVNEISTELKVNPNNVRSAVAGLARDGYVKWNPDTEQITLLPKASHYVNSSRGKKDYDHIAIKSLSPSGKNATLNLASNDLIVRGVERFNFSDDSVTVFVKPDSSIIRIQKNRAVTFNGTVVASAFIFKGKEFKFDYDGFYVDLVKIDSIIVRGKGTRGNALRARRNTDFALTNKNKTSTGRLYINAPNNKSGRKKLGAYPTFEASTGAYVFFNKPEVLGGAYDTTVYFDIPPFKLDSLNNKNRSAVGFKGTFMSGDILPPFQTKLSLQDDGSLGFVYNLPKSGVPVYGGKGRVFNQIRMSNRGIQGVGEMKYLTGTFASEQFIFYKDSVVTIGKSADIAKGPLNGVEFAAVSLQPGYGMKWVVKADSMYLSTPNASTMKYYAGAYTYRGTTILTPGGLYGSGTLDGPQSFIRSKLFVFRPDSYSGKHATINIKSAEANKPALTANDVSFDFEVKKGYADFAREEGSKASIELPYTQYRTTLSGGHWDFKKKNVQMKVAAGADSTKAFFYSTKPDQHNLRFPATNGSYDLSRYRLIATGVPRIASADAWIEPDSNKVYVLPNAQMKTFQNAGIIMDTLTKFHRLYKGEIKVLGRTAFTGNALHSYKNASADSFAIKFSNFTVDSLAAKGGKKGKKLRKGDEDTFAPPTIAQANVLPAEKFHLAPRIAYRGGVNLNSQRRGFTFDGQSRLEFSKQPASAEWFTVQDSIDPKNVRIKLIDPKAEDGSPMVTGLFMSDVSNKVYPLFVATKPGITDLNLFQVDGYLSFDAKRREFTLSRNDLSDPNLYEGSVMTFNDSTQAMTFRGKFNLINSNKDYTLTAAGLGTAKTDSAKYSLDTFMAFDINMPEKALEAMATDMATNTKGAPEALDGSMGQLYKMGEFVGSKTVQSYSNRKGGYTPLQKVSPKFMHSIVLNKVDLRWSEKNRAWYSVGKIGLVSILKKDLNALIDGYVEIRRENGVDNVELYLEAEPQTWYYIKYSNNVLLAKAQHGSFDEILSFKAKGDYNTATQYGFYLGDDQEVQGFLTRFRKLYLGAAAAKAAAPVRSAAPGSYDIIDEPGKKKKKKKEDEVEDGSQPAADATPVEEESKKKKKKKKDDDPFSNSDGATDPEPTKAAAAAPAPAKPAPVTPQPAPAATTPAATAPAKAADPTPAATTPATPDPADAAKAAAESKKEEEKKAKEAAKEAERLKKEEEKKAKEAEKLKKEEEKKKKAKEDDPFGDS